MAFLQDVAMKNKLIILASITLLAGFSAFSQADSTRYINGLPVSDDDTVQQFPQNDLAPAKKITPVEVKNLPAKLREALEQGAQYEGWKDSTVYFDNNTQQYIVPVKYEGGVKIFGVDKDGNPVRYSEVDK